ncbi:MAG: hypothetical protein L6R35_007085 [Caloplaca aegaea]|nr:MAG: hypothetical protein L6R35_007085 [Caloplaca aegaea]
MHRFTSPSFKLMLLPPSQMVPRSLFRIPKPAFRLASYGSRSFTLTTATLRTSSGATEQIECSVIGFPFYSLGIPKHAGYILAGQDLGNKSRKVNLVFYDGCYFATSPDSKSARLTLADHIAPLLSSFGGSKIPAILYNFGELKGSGIALKDTEGVGFLETAAIGAENLKQTLRDLE